MSNSLVGLELKVSVNGYAYNRQTVSGNISPQLLVNGYCNGSQTTTLSLLENKNKCENVPFPMLMGEFLKQTNYGAECNVFLTNYRLFIAYQDYIYSIPVKCIEYVEMREILCLCVICKDGKLVRISFESPEKCSEWWGYITQNDVSQSSIENLFAFQFYSHMKSSGNSESFSNISQDSADGEVLMFVNDNKRMEFNLKTIWRTTEINSKFEICDTYPKLHIVPAWITDEDLRIISQFRALRRFPSVVWRNKDNGAVIARSSQPELGWFGWRCEKDEILLSAIAQAAKLDSNNNKQNMAVSVTDNGRYAPTSSSTSDFLLLDARSYPAALANRAKGGGCECQEYYPNCDIQFMGLPNIHDIRKSFQSVRALCLLGVDQSNWYSALEATRWLQYISGLIRSTLVIVDAIHLKGRSTLVHCSDGWDRTTQLVSLAELLLDPYYRTIQGFRVLVEREWLNFGHKFADRCGHIKNNDPNERSPVFFQWLDAIHQIMKQYPSAFEFNENFLRKLSQHVYGCLFGTFLCNSARERRQLKLKSRTVSVWDLLLSGRKDFYNFLYDGNCHLIYPSYNVRNLLFWESAFIQDNMLTSQSSQKSYCTRLHGPIPKVCRRISRERTLSANNFDTLFQPKDNNIFKEYTGCDSNNDTEKNDNKYEGKQPDTSLDHNTRDDINKNSSITASFETEFNKKLNIEPNSNDVITLKQESADDSLMTDSSLTLTNEADASILITNFDDPGVNSLHGSPQAHRSNGFIRTHSAPDSPTMARLLRTKSVPDVTNMNLNKYQPTFDGHELEHKASFQQDFSKYVDIDGLMFTNNFIDQKLQEIHSTHAHELSRLQKKLERQQHVPNHIGDGSYSSASHNEVPDDMLSITDSLHGERSSVSSISNEETWEQVNIDDVQPTRWLPDHISPICLSCSCTFTMLYRRHHCRKCGGVFCDSCSSYKIPIPEEQHYNPVRVCIQCYEKHLSV